jgi:protein-S-isoprenylcysteine O-methyltransferase Ste14
MDRHPQTARHIFHTLTTFQEVAMHFIHLFRGANSLWLFFCLYFLVRYRPTQAKRSVPVSIFSLERLSLLLAVPLVFFPRTHVFFLGTRFHSSYAVAFAGLVLVTLGLAFAAWARDLLGRNWSGQVIIQDHHQLITAGPYAYIRHPLYTGLLVAIVGMSLVIGDLGSVLGVLFAILFASLKASREERLLATEFGTAYTIYRSQTGAMLPRLSHAEPSIP